jgi:hypothetical protein
MAVAATARQAHRLYSVLRVIAVVCILFSLDTSFLLFFFPYARTRTYHAIVSHWLAYFFSVFYHSVRVHGSIKGEIAYRAVFGKLLTGGTRLGRCIRDLGGDVEAKEGLHSGSIDEVWWPRKAVNQSSHAKGGSVGNIFY